MDLAAKNLEFELAATLRDKIASAKELDAHRAFTLKTGMGIPEDLLEEFCLRQGIIFPKADFLRFIEEHKGISRQPKK
jgi:alanyl-tRNA synthetase